MATSKRRWQPWSVEEEAELREMAATNVSITRMAVRLGRCMKAIKSKLRQINASSANEADPGRMQWRERNTIS